MIGIAVGNSPKQIHVWKKQLHVSFPVFPDRKMKIWHLLGTPSTPTFIVVAKNQKVLMVHQGPIHDLDKMLEKLRELDKSN